MDLTVNENEISVIADILREQKFTISKKAIRETVSVLNRSLDIFPVIKQKAMIVRLFANYTGTKKNEVIILNESGEVPPMTVSLGVLAEDWPGMSNALLGIIHHEDWNVLFIKGFTLAYHQRELGIVIMAFQIEEEEACREYRASKKGILQKIKNASRGTLSKEKLLDEEVIKLEIFHDIVNRIKRKNLDSREIEELTGQNGEALKFVSCRSREYLEQRSIADLSRLIVDNYRLTRKVRAEGGIQVKINNFVTRYEKLTGITLVSREDVISIEEFLETLEMIVPQYMIKHHKSFVTNDQILIYRLEIMDRYGKPLKKGVIESIEKTLKRLILSTHQKGFTKLKSIGGFEHFARAVIPFLIDEYRKTGISQAFINSEKKTVFFVDIRLIVVSGIRSQPMYRRFLNRLLNAPGFNINMIMPPKRYSQDVEINILKLRVDFSVFCDLKEIYSVLNGIIEKYYGEVRDFDKGFREIDISKLKSLYQRFPDLSRFLINEIFFSFDELYRIEKPVELFERVVDLCSGVIDDLEKDPDSCETALRKDFLKSLDLGLMVISCMEQNQRSVLKKIVKQTAGDRFYLFRVEWNQRVYLVIALDGAQRKLTEQLMNQIAERVKTLVCSGRRLSG